MGPRRRRIMRPGAAAPACASAPPSGISADAALASGRAAGLTAADN
jgi:hypothetical protein